MTETARKLPVPEPREGLKAVEAVDDMRRLLREHFGGMGKTRVLNHLRNKFNLKQEDLDEETVKEIAEHIRTHKGDVDSITCLLISPKYNRLIIIGLKRHLAAKFNIDWDKIPPPTRSVIIRNITSIIKSNPRFNIYEAVLFGEIIPLIIEEIRLKNIERAKDLRQDAVRETEERYKFPKGWTDNEDRLSRGEYYCQRSEVKYLSTYFDSAAFGIINKKLVQQAEMRGQKAYLDFPTHVSGRKKTILDYYDRSQTDEHYGKDGIFFFSSASSAFQAYADQYLNKGDIVVTTSEEYQGIKKMLKSKNVKIISIPVCSNNDEYTERLRVVLKDKDVKAVMISEISRRGTIFPLDRFRKEIDNASPNTQFIVDGTQATGRKHTDFSKFKPDAYFASCQKGSDLGGPVGLLILSNEFIKNNGAKIESPEGTEDTIAIEKMTMACDKETIDEREKRLKSLSRKFVEIVEAINGKNGNKIHILRPLEDTLSDDENLSGIFEIEIDGKSRFEVNKSCRDYGVFIANQYYDPLKEKNSFRIAFHPYMNDDSVKILAYILDELTKLP
jgi:selenocysteine lyase/cysteine desulfurase